MIAGNVCWMSTVHQSLNTFGIRPFFLSSPSARSLRVCSRSDDDYLYIQSRECIISYVLLQQCQRADYGASHVLFVLVLTLNCVSQCQLSHILTICSTPIIRTDGSFPIYGTRKYSMFPILHLLCNWS